MQQQHMPLVKEVEFGDFWKNLKPTFWWPQNLYNDPDMNCEEYRASICANRHSSIKQQICNFLMLFFQIE